MDVWLQLFRGPVFWTALTFMIVGLVRHVGLTAWEMLRVKRKAGDKTIPTGQVFAATLKWLFPVDRLRNRMLFSLSSLVFHVSVIVVPIFLAGHIALWERGIGLTWPALPNGAATALTLAAVVTAVALVVQRIGARDTRALSRFQDYALPLIAAMPFASGFMVMHPAWNPLSHDLTLLVHVVSADLLLFLVPVTKLNHMALLPSMQLVSELAWHFPPDAGSKVAVTLGKVDEPI